MDDIQEESDHQQRKYSRVDAFIPLEYKLIKPQNKELLRPRMVSESILAEFKSLPNPDDQLIAQWLQSINAKLDEIIRMLALQQGGFNCLNIMKVNISGGGLSLNTTESFNPGDILEIKILLGIKAPLALFLYGEVVDAALKPEGYNTCVLFINMDDFARDEIIHFVFETEREILREKRRKSLNL